MSRIDRPDGTDQAHELLALGRMPTGAASDFLVKYFMEQNPDVEFRVICDEEEYPLILSENGDLLVVMGNHRKLASSIKGVCLTYESSLLFKKLQRDQARARLEQEKQHVSMYVERVVPKAPETPLNDDEIQNLMIGLHNIGSVGLRKLSDGGVALSRPNRNIVNRILRIIDRLKELGLSMNDFDNDPESGLSYPHKVVYFDAQGELKTVLEEFFRRAVYGNRHKLIPDFLSRSTAKNVLIMSYSRGVKDGYGSLSLSQLDQIEIREVDQVDF